MRYSRGLNDITTVPAKGMRPRRERHRIRRKLKALCPRISFWDFIGVRR